MELVIALLGGSFGAGLLSLVQLLLKRRWDKHDKGDQRMDALVEAQKVIMVDRVRYLGGRYIRDGRISLDDKTTLQDMYAAYKSLGGNGHLKTIMAEVDKLPVREE